MSWRKTPPSVRHIWETLSDNDVEGNNFPLIPKVNPVHEFMVCTHVSGIQWWLYSTLMLASLHLVALSEHLRMVCKPVIHEVVTELKIKSVSDGLGFSYWPLLLLVEVGLHWASGCVRTVYSWPCCVTDDGVALCGVLPIPFKGCRVTQQVLPTISCQLFPKSLLCFIIF